MRDPAIVAALFVVGILLIVGAFTGRVGVFTAVFLAPDALTIQGA